METTTGLSIARNTAALHEQTAGWRTGGGRVALVPTMGAIHRAHLSLIEIAAKRADHVVVSIFVNPKQFGPGEDFEDYPRPLATDLEALRATAAGVVFLPGLEEIYPPDLSADIAAGNLGDMMCGQSRPGHFDGVATVVARLFRLCHPDLAVFGEKDFQQLQIIRAMVLDQAMPVEIIGAPLCRDDDGLAISSRNAYLSEGERRAALALPETLKDLTTRAGQGEALRELEKEGLDRLQKAGLSVEYLEFRTEEGLKLAADISRPLRLFAALRAGRTRLIDNVQVGAPSNKTQ